MQIHRNYKFRLYPTKSQIDLLNLHFFLSNQAWNSTLAQKMTDLKANAHLLPADRDAINVVQYTRTIENRKAILVV